MKQRLDISWWYWLITTALIAFGLTGFNICFFAVIALTVIQIIHFMIRERSTTAFPIQVRIAYLGLLFLGQWAPMYWIYYVQLIGGTAMVTVGYCPLARILSLLPWNRHEPFSLALVLRTFLTPPVRGNILQGLPSEVGR